MSLYIEITPRPIAFSGNPIKLEVTSSSPVTYQIKDGAAILFEGSAEAGNFHVFIDEILSEELKPTRYTGEEPDMILNTADNMKDYTVTVKNETGEVREQTQSVLLGGISKRAMRNLHNVGSNIFTYKLMNPAGNYLMTTRGEKRTITLRESELYPLLFIASTNEITIKAAENATRTLELENSKLYGLNLEAIRYSFFSVENILCNQFEVITDESVLTVIIEPSEVTKERYFLEFLNSYGAYERIEITGMPKLEQEQEEDKVFGVYDSLVNDYVEHRERVISQNSIRAQTGFKNENEYIFILDMLSSDDIRLIGYEEREIKVNATAESLTFAKTGNEPQSISLILKFADKETHFTQALLDDDFDNPRIHTEQFTKEFN